MEREILFRGKRADNGEWVEGCFVKYQPCASEDKCIVGIVPEYASALYLIEIDPSTLGQFTGLTDKNGVKIFEGDVFKFRSGIYFVEWNNEHSKFLQRCKQFSRELHICIAESEIIGNIHDNPELLKGEPNV